MPECDGHDAPEDILTGVGFEPEHPRPRRHAAAREAGFRLVLAGPENDYSRRHIRHLIDDDRVRYIGSVNRAQRNQLLGGARALLYPLREPEPFGLVQVEAMMCGTPVVASIIGAVPEIVEHGRTGILTESPSQLAAAIGAASGLDRGLIQRLARERFSVSRMAQSYETLYQREVGERSPRAE